MNEPINQILISKEEIEALEPFNKFKKYYYSFERYLIHEKIEKEQREKYQKSPWWKKFLGIVRQPDLWTTLRMYDFIPNLDTKTIKTAELNGWLDEFEKMLNKYGYTQKNTK